MSARNQSDTQLTGFWLAAGRLAWAAVFGLIVGLFVIRAPYAFSAARFDETVRQTILAVAPLAAYSEFVLYVVVLRYVAALIFILTGALIFWRRSDDWVALLVSITLVMFSYYYLSGAVEIWRYSPPVAWLLSAVQATIPLVTVLSFVLLLYLFPDGRFVPRWASWLVGAVGLMTTGFWLYLVLGLEARLIAIEEWAWVLVAVTIIACILVGGAAQVYRFRRLADPVQRQQTRLVLFGLGAQLIWLVWDWPWALGFLEDTALRALIEVHVQILLPVLVPLTIGASILRYRLWDVDLLINRALVYGALTGIVTGLYVLLVGGLGAALQLQGNLVIAIVVTGLVAVLARPLQARLQRAVNQVMYGERDDPVAVLTSLGQRLEATASADAALPALVETMTQAFRLPYAAIALKRGDEYRVVAAAGCPAGDALILPLVYQGQRIGRLTVSPRAPGEAFSASDRRLLATIARQAGIAAQAAQLASDLRRSRERLVTAQEEERRRLRRDLHDDLGPQLAALALKLDGAHNLLKRDPEGAERLLLDARVQIQGAIADVRRLAHDLRPPALDQLGLVPALREQAIAHSASSGLRVSVEAPEPFPPLPAATEVVAYRIASEALTNVARHAQARVCTIQLALNGALKVEVSDDGTGLPDGYRAGVGLASMRERALELGGTFKIESRAQGGTRVSAELPLVIETPQAYGGEL